MVYIETQAEEDFLENTISHNSVLQQGTARNVYWIGLTRDCKDTKIWIDGSEVIYNKFGSSESTTEGCFQMIDSEENGNFEWSTVTCAIHRRFICEEDRSNGKTQSQYHD